MPPMRPPMFLPPRGGGMMRPGMAPRGIMGAANNAGARGLFAPQAQGAVPGVQRSGGILSSLFGRSGGAAGNAATVARSVTGAAGTAAQGGSSLTNIMNGTQKVLAAGERIVPMVRQVQQYGPLIKNLPSMWKMYRGLNASSSNAEDSAASVSSLAADDSSAELKETAAAAETSLPKGEEIKQDSPIRTESKPSVPKLFI